ncbi:PfkB family carbohydrate kinase [Mycoplasmatota bacterium WC30]
MKYDLITSGYCALDRIIKTETQPATGKTSIVTNKNHAEIYYGGCNVNVAYNLAKLGKIATPIFRVGYDYESTGFYQYLKNGNVNLDAVQKLDFEATSSTYLVETPDNEHITLFYPGAMDKKYHIAYEDSWFENTKCALMTVASLADNKDFLNKVIKHKIPLFLGMKMDSDAFPKPFLKECLNQVEVLFANKSEAACIVDLYDLNNINELLTTLPNIKVIVTTKGKLGSIATYRVKDTLKTETVEIVKAEKVIDTVGSGDAYVAGYIYGYLNNETIKKSMEYGSTLASFVIEGLGSTASSPTEEEFIKRYTNNYNKGNS